MSNSYKAYCPLGKDLILKKEYSETSDKYLDIVSDTDISNYFNDFGYIVQRQMINHEICNNILENFKNEIKPSKEYIYRQASAKPEKHSLTENGYILNSILNPQSTHPRFFPNFRNSAAGIISSKSIQKTLRVLMGESGKAVQAMFFDGNPVTWAHQDCYYLDAEKEGEMIGIWIALEDIHAGAGRFYIYPKSHRIDIKKNGGNFDIAFNHIRYKELVKQLIEDFDLNCHAPALKKGDVLFWSSKTIHGSLEAFEPQFSRKSITCHYIPQSSKFMQFQKLEKPLHLKSINGVEVNFPKDLNQLNNRIIHKVETTFPRGFNLAKKVAIKLLVK